MVYLPSFWFYLKQICQKMREKHKVTNIETQLVCNLREQLENLTNSILYAIGT